MYCPIVVIFPNLCRSVPGDNLSVIGRKSGIDI